MSLAQRLNELAQANSDGLLSDDEYRLLRQSAFEHHANPSPVPIERPIVPTVPTRHGLTSKSPGSRGKSSKEQTRDEQPLKLSVTNIFRRATGKHSPAVLRSENTLPPSPVAPASGENSPSSPRRGLIPRLFHRKPSEPPPLRITPSQSHPNMRSPISPQTPARTLPRSSHLAPKAPRRIPSQTQVNNTANTAFDDRSLVSSQDIREAILALENELYGLVDAFNNLEQTAVRRIKKRTARRLPATTPDSVDVLLEGREWREHRMIPSPSTPAFDSRTRAHRYHRPLESVVADGQSVYSARSDKTSLSQSKSISHLSQQQQLPPSSPLSSHFRIPSSGLQRKSSVSSVSSRGTSSLLSASRLGVSPSSTAHLPLHTVTQLPYGEDDEVIELEEDLEGGTDQLSELHEIQERRNEVITRYTQRIEYLKAKQKGAELHERLLRK